jgi:hypothetical protein
MAELHGLGASLVLGAAMLLAIGSALLVRRGGSIWVDRGRIVVLALVATESLLGALAWLGGDRALEALHYLYGVAALATLPLAATFASDAPPRARAALVAVASLVLTVLAWRLASTG